MRLETQNTIETLREEFDQLVKELAKYKKKDHSSSNVSGLGEITQSPSDQREDGQRIGQQILQGNQPKGVAGIPKLKLGNAGK